MGGKKARRRHGVGGVDWEKQRTKESGQEQTSRRKGS